MFLSSWKTHHRRSDGLYRRAKASKTRCIVRLKVWVRCQHRAIGAEVARPRTKHLLSKTVLAIQFNDSMRMLIVCFFTRHMLFLHRISGLMPWNSWRICLQPVASHSLNLVSIWRHATAMTLRHSSSPSVPGTTEAVTTMVSFIEETCTKTFRVHSLGLS